MQHLTSIVSPGRPPELSAAAAKQAVAAVDRYLRTEIEARALAFILAQGWIETIGRGRARWASLAAAAGLTPAGAALLFGILAAGRVIAEEQGNVVFTPAFIDALRYRDLLEAKLWFANFVAPDVHDLFGTLLTDMPHFMGRAKVFQLFRYDLAMAVTPDNLTATARWVGYTTVLTRYEAGAGLDRLELGGRRHMLDVGGNSGEFVRQAVERQPGLTAEVFDLPVVCELGRRHLAATKQKASVHFTPGDLRQQPLPQGADVICFKSMLHDWPDHHAREFLQKTWDALPPNGLLVIYERAEIAIGAAPLPYSMVANLVFLPFFRPAALYMQWLAEFGFEGIAAQEFTLEMSFQVITARKPA